MKAQAIILAAGAGTRLKEDKIKSLIVVEEASQKPLFVYCLETFERSSLIDSVILIVPESHRNDFAAEAKKFKLTKVKKIIAGGLERCDSVQCGLKALDEDTQMVVLHDAARPFVTLKMIEDVIASAKEHAAAVVGVPAKSTIKRVDPKKMAVEETLKRDTLFEIQTPQVFKKNIILKAHAKKDIENPTDDAVLVERLGVNVKMVMGDYKNIKITTADDLILAQTFLRP